MAIINTYPTVTPKGADLLVGTQVADDTVEQNSTKTFSVSSIGSYIITENSGITGSGTANTVPIFTTDGTTIGDSDIVKNIDGIYTSYDIGSDLPLRSRLKVYDNDINCVFFFTRSCIKNSVDQQ